VNILATSREQIEVYKFSLPVAIGVPLAAILFQSFVSVYFSWLLIFDLPLLVTISFAVARRNQVAGLANGAFIGLVQDSLTHRYVGLYGIAKTIVGYAASSLGVKIDVDNPGTRFLMTYAFYIVHQSVYFLVARGLANEQIDFRWMHLLLAALANAFLAIPVFALLDRFKQRA
jgi:rod shape-determining protein MreD